METVQQVADRLGTEVAVKWADHRIEALEAEIRSNYQALKALSDAVLGHYSNVNEVAGAVRALLEVKRLR